VLVRAVTIPGESERLVAGPALMTRCFGIDRCQDAQLVHPHLVLWIAPEAIVSCGNVLCSRGFRLSPTGASTPACVLGCRLVPPRTTFGSGYEEVARSVCLCFPYLIDEFAVGLCENVGCALASIV